MKFKLRVENGSLLLSEYDAAVLPKVTFTVYLIVCFQKDQINIFEGRLTVVQELMPLINTTSIKAFVIVFY